MKIKILQEKLQQAISQVEKISGKDTTLPILSNVLLKAEKNSLTLIASNLETGISWKMLSKVEEDGSAAVPAQMFSGLINSLPGGTVDIQTKDNSIFILNDRRKSNLNSLPADEFPVLPVNTDSDFLTVRADLFCQAISCVAGFAGSSSIKPEITGVYVSFLGDVIKVVATDSFRLGEKIIQVSRNGKQFDNNSVIVPVKAAREIVSVFGDKQKNIKIYITNNQITLDLTDEGDADSPKIQFTTRLIEGDFPDYQTIIPVSYSANAVFSKKEMLSQLKPAGIFSGKNNEINIKVSPQKLIMGIYSQTTDMGAYESELKLKNASGKDISIVFNNRFLADGLSVIKEDDCVFDFSGEDSPSVLKSTKDSDFIYILMPIKKY